MTAATAIATEARAIVFRTRGSTHGPIRWIPPPVVREPGQRHNAP
jgi:hypothetical protein